MTASFLLFPDRQKSQSRTRVLSDSGPPPPIWVRELPKSSTLTALCDPQALSSRRLRHFVTKTQA